MLKNLPSSKSGIIDIIPTTKKYHCAEPISAECGCGLLPIALFSILNGLVEINAQKNGRDWLMLAKFSVTWPRSYIITEKQ